MFKKSLNVYDTWFGFYIHFKKVTFVCRMATTGINGLSFKQALMRSGIVQYKLSGVSGFIFDQTVLTFLIRDFFEVASGNLLTSS